MSGFSPDAGKLPQPSPDSYTFPKKENELKVRRVITRVFGDRFNEAAFVVLQK
jgi:hypothetical protein